MGTNTSRGEINSVLFSLGHKWFDTCEVRAVIPEKLQRPKRRCAMSIQIFF